MLPFYVFFSFFLFLVVGGLHGCIQWAKPSLHQKSFTSCDCEIVEMQNIIYAYLIIVLMSTYMLLIFG